jgi:hypothetical protein
MKIERLLCQRVGVMVLAIMVIVLESKGYNVRK